MKVLVAIAGIVVLVDLVSLTMMWTIMINEIRNMKKTNEEEIEVL